MADIKNNIATIPAAQQGAAKDAKVAPSSNTVSIGKHFSESLSLQSVKSKVASIEKTGETWANKGIQELKSVLDSLLERMGLSSVLESSREEEKKKEKAETKKKEEAAWYANGEQIARARYRELHQAA